MKWDLLIISMTEVRLNLFPSQIHIYILPHSLVIKINDDRVSLYPPSMPDISDGMSKIIPPLILGMLSRCVAMDTSGSNSSGYG